MASRERCQGSVGQRGKNLRIRRSDLSVRSVASRVPTRLTMRRPSSYTSPTGGCWAGKPLRTGYQDPAGDRSPNNAAPPLPWTAKSSFLEESSDPKPALFFNRVKSRVFQNRVGTAVLEEKGDSAPTPSSPAHTAASLFVKPVEGQALCWMLGPCLSKSALTRREDLDPGPAL